MTPKIGVAPQRREQLLDATFECIATQGYGNFSLQDVAERASVSKGIIHYYFRDKEELLLLVLDRLTQHLDDLVNRKADTDRTPQGRICAIFDGSFEVVQQKVDFFHVFFDFCGQATKKKDMQEITHTLYAKYRRRTQWVIEDGIAQGIFRQVDVAKVSTILVGAVMGICLQYILDKEAFSLSEVQKACEDIILSYLQPPKKLL
jgi:AcrR family transcriptional regulator|tara:strand:+ start:49 stop:660 length:612 start_codon:yes stop_codon:yes gene_type:complete